MLYFISECDIEYISPSNYKPPELQNKGTNGEVMDADDHYERLVRGSLKVIEKQKVKRNQCLLIFLLYFVLNKPSVNKIKAKYALFCRKTN